ncbi:MAG: hypothetical protein FJ086_05880 [Deltaproteobacteria bacterium]|nr:hypothetical protein [Deltaproteobacteria bacterium]
MALGPDGNVYVADSGNQCVRRVTPAGDVTTAAARSGGWCCRDGRASQRGTGCLSPVAAVSPTAAMRRARGAANMFRTLQRPPGGSGGRLNTSAVAGPSRVPGVRMRSSAMAPIRVVALPRLRSACPSRSSKRVASGRRCQARSNRYRSSSSINRTSVAP